MRVFSKVLLFIFCLTAVGLLSGCSEYASAQTVSPPTVQSSTETTLAPMPTSMPTSSLTSTPTLTPTPTHTPTPTPEYIEPLMDEPVWYNGYVDPRSIRAEVVSNPEDITVLINKYYAMPEDYVPEIVKADSSAGQYLRTEANDAWDLMRAACKEDIGQTLYLVSGYRTYQTQAYSFSHAIERRGIAKVCEKNAYQGRSEHSLGLALDINIASDPEIRDEFVESTAGQWVKEHGHEYGFILRYPRDKGDIIGYGYEAWHYRFVGVELATTLHESGQTLEEYYGKEQVMPE